MRAELTFRFACTPVGPPLPAFPTPPFPSTASDTWPGFSLSAGGGPSTDICQASSGTVTHLRPRDSGGDGKRSCLDQCRRLCPGLPLPPTAADGTCEPLSQSGGSSAQSPPPLHLSQGDGPSSQGPTPSAFAHCFNHIDLLTIPPTCQEQSPSGPLHGLCLLPGLSFLHGPLLPSGPCSNPLPGKLSSHPPT